MSDIEGIKSFVYAFLQKHRRKTPEYIFQQRSAGHGRLRFICELRVDGFPYVGIGNSVNKKDAQTNSARDFANYLVREGLIKDFEVPRILPEEYTRTSEEDVKPVLSLAGPSSNEQQSRDSHIPPPRSDFDSDYPRDPRDSYINRIMDQKKLEEAEEVDLTADIHGGWSMENAKARLNEYLQSTRQQPVNVKYTAIGPDHNSQPLGQIFHLTETKRNTASPSITQALIEEAVKFYPRMRLLQPGCTIVFRMTYLLLQKEVESFFAESTVLAKRINKQLYGRENGSNKAMASRACCLSLVRQLFHVGEIEAYSGERRKKKSDELPPISVELDPHLERRLHALLVDLHMLPSLTPPAPRPMSAAAAESMAYPEEHNLILNYKIADFAPQPRQSAQLVSWCPPATNWNPWTACNIDEGPDAVMPLSEISKSYQEQYRRRLTSPGYCKIHGERNALPAASYQQEILDAICRNQVTLIRGETGCGKTTQIPQFILDSYLASGRGADCCVLVTQPRRICAISLAERIASERCEPIGTSVGFSVRFETVLPRPYGSILFCTVGTLCRKMEAGIRGVSHIIIDEIHERDVNTDFVLILMRDLVRANRDLRLILMSATIDTTTFTDYFDNCGVVELEGRTHSVTYYYLEDCINMINYRSPPCPDDRKKASKKARSEEQIAADNEENCNLICPSGYPQSVSAVMREMSEKEVHFPLIAGLLDHICGMSIEGAVLIFLPGWNIISMLRKFLQSHPRYSNSADFYILPLHSQVPREEQRLVFRPVAPGVRKIVLSTNIAESSITIDDVVFVIDSCLARVKMFTARNNLTTYSTVWASRTNMEQRRGRAGRVRPGFAFHLCSRARLARLDQCATPEILRTPLHELALMIKLIRLGDIAEFLKKAIQPPPIDAVIEAEYTLREMKALDSNDELTPLGKILARLPIEPRLGRMLVFACAFRLGGAMTVLAAHASFGSDAFSMPPDRRRLSWEQIRFAGGTKSDHLAALNVFQTWSRELRRGGEQAALYLCESRELNGSSLRIIEDAASQIRGILIALDFPESVLSDPPIHFGHSACPAFDYIGAMLTSGLYPNVAFHADKRKLLTAEGKCALVHKASVNCIREPHFPFPLFTFTEKIRTLAISCKNLTMITPIQLMLFGCRRGVWRPDQYNPDSGIILLDNWLPLRMRFDTAVKVLALRPALEALLVRICLQPGILDTLSSADEAVIEITKSLCEQTALKGPRFGETPSGGGEGVYSGGDYNNNNNIHRFATDSRRPLLSGDRRRVGPEMDTSAFSRYEVHGRGGDGYPRRRIYNESGDYRSCDSSSVYAGTQSGNRYQEYQQNSRGNGPAIKRDYSLVEQELPQSGNDYYVAPPQPSHWDYGASGATDQWNSDPYSYYQQYPNYQYPHQHNAYPQPPPPPRYDDYTDGHPQDPSYY